MTDLTDQAEIKKQYAMAKSLGRNPLFSDLPRGTIITDEMRLERLRNPLRFEYRRFSCPVCGEVMDYAGWRLLYETTEMREYLFTCRTCNANVTYTPLEAD